MRIAVRDLHKIINGFIGDPVCNQRGSILIGVIVTMVVVATLGTAMVTLTTTSTYTHVGAFDAAKAYYLAEAGGRYAIPIIRQEALNGGDPFDPATGTIARLNGKTFTMTDGDMFRLVLSYAAPTYTLESFGLLRQGANAFEASRKVTFVINASVAPGVAIAFDNTSDLRDNLGAVAGAAKATGGKLKIDKDNTELGLKWDGSASLPNLADMWSSNDGLLGYSLQIKAALNPGIKAYVGGISFRLDSATDSSYGFSFARRSGPGSQCGSLPVGFCAQDGNGNFIIEEGFIYIVLWKKVAGNYTILDSRKAQTADGVIDNPGLLKAWSTLVVRVEERYRTDSDGNYLDINGQITTDPAARTRENVITAYVQGQDDTDAKAYKYRRDINPCDCDTSECSCTIHWQYGKFNPVNWEGAGLQPITDSTLTSEDFGVVRPEEIGIHYVGDSGERFFDDFAITVDGGAGGGGGNSILRY
ncbi:MAG: hypothetical protein OEL66_04220 [Desulfobulbaceae bacterium]|nr:hypothetical protein [Desulfobulbaceae bacterium]